jgi:hypothetical protein
MAGNQADVGESESSDQTRKYAISTRITVMVMTDAFTRVMKLR